VRACRTASIAATCALLALGAIGACREPARPEIPPLTTATADGGGTLAVAAASRSDAPDDAAAGSVLAAALDAPSSPVIARFVDAPVRLEASQCRRGLLAVVKGTVVALGETLAVGDVLVVSHGTAAFEATGTGTSVWATTAIPSCAVLSLLPLDKAVVRGAATPKVEWAGGTMSARLDVRATGPKAPSPAPELYLGRLEGTASVAEHDHATSWEILAAVEASGSFVLDGVDHRLGARQIVTVPPGVKHAWRPDPGAKLVAIQMYAPPGPELRFGALAAADKAAVKDAGPRDAR
jgi:mannose-6-phosphate isomerase-like protein (cupin superfamily)